MNKYLLFYSFVYTLMQKKIDKKISLLQSLLLFTISLLTNKNNVNFDTELNIFTYDLGFMEKDILEKIKNTKFNGIVLVEEGQLLVNYDAEQSIDKKYFELSGTLIGDIINKNKDIINYSPSQLVDLFHKWEAYRIAKRLNVEKVTIEYIKTQSFGYYI